MCLIDRQATDGLPVARPDSTNGIIHSLSITSGRLIELRIVIHLLKIDASAVIVLEETADHIYLGTDTILYATTLHLDTSIHITNHIQQLPSSYAQIICPGIFNFLFNSTPARYCTAAWYSCLALPAASHPSLLVLIVTSEILHAGFVFCSERLAPCHSSPFPFPLSGRCVLPLLPLMFLDLVPSCYSDKIGKQTPEQMKIRLRDEEKIWRIARDNT
jgi:hypothetical protein